MGIKVDAKKEIFEEVTVLDKPMLFTCARVDRSTVPKGMYLYEVRHDDEMRGDPCQIANWIMVNHWGTLISNERIPLERSPHTNNAYRDIDPEKTGIMRVWTVRSKSIWRNIHLKRKS